MPYRDIALISIYGLRGTLYVQKAGNAEGVSVQAEGHEVKVVAEGSRLKIYPEGQELQIYRSARSGITAWGTDVGSVQVSARMRSLTDPGPQVRARTPDGVRATIRITAPAGTQVELIDCYGLLTDSHDRLRMQGSGRFGIR